MLVQDKIMVWLLEKKFSKISFLSPLHIFDYRSNYGSIHHIQLWIHELLSRVCCTYLNGLMVSKPVDECLIIVRDLKIVGKAFEVVDG